MTSPHAEPYVTPHPCMLIAAVLALLLFVLATEAAAQTRERMWTVTCGLPTPKPDNPRLARLLEVAPTGGYNGPWEGDPRSGHLMVKTLNRLHPEGNISGEMWVLSRNVGWWRLKAIRVHPDDRPKLSDIPLEAARQPLVGIRQIIDSPFLSRPAIIRAGNSNDEELINGQILALMPNASRLRCASSGRRKESGGP